jgi:plasmid stability protein
MAALSIRNRDDHVRELLRMRAAAHGRSMESEIQALLAAAEILFGIERLPPGQRKGRLRVAAIDTINPWISP